MAKAKTIYICADCGAHSPRWQGRCTECGAWNSLNEEVVGPSGPSLGGMTLHQGEGQLVPLNEVSGDDNERQVSGISELDRVLGGGIVNGSIILIGGAPGIGKSTLLLQVAKAVSETMSPILYVSGEESPRQIKLRAERLKAVSDRVLLFNETRFEAVEKQLMSTKPGLAIIDSVQTLFRSDLSSAPGSVTQVRECAAALMRIAKTQQIPIVLVGHVTKDGNLAGPRVLEHLVDTVLSFEGETDSQLRILRSSKNRFGASHEVGLFEMTSAGLVPVTEASSFFLEQRAQGLTGSLVYPSLEGSRPILVEVQALVVESYAASQGAPAVRRAVGIDQNRMSLLLAVLSKKLKNLEMGKRDVYSKVAGGLKLHEPALDLALAMALLSSRQDEPISSGIAAFGEVGLGGEVRPIAGTEIRLKELERMGFSDCALPLQSITTALEKQCKIRLHGIKNVRELEALSNLGSKGSPAKELPSEPPF